MGGGGRVASGGSQLGWLGVNGVDNISDHSAQPLYLRGSGLTSRVKVAAVTATSALPVSSASTGVTESVAEEGLYAMPILTIQCRSWS